MDDTATFVNVERASTTALAWANLPAALEKCGSGISCRKIMTIASRSKCVLDALQLDLTVALDEPFLLSMVPGTALEFVGEWLAREADPDAPVLRPRSRVWIVRHCRAWVQLPHQARQQLIARIQQWLALLDNESAMVIFLAHCESPSDVDPFRAVSDVFQYVPSPGISDRIKHMRQCLVAIDEDEIPLTVESPDLIVETLKDASASASHDQIKGFITDAALQAFKDGKDKLTAAFLETRLRVVKGMPSLSMVDVAQQEHRLLAYAGMLDSGDARVPGSDVRVRKAPSEDVIGWGDQEDEPEKKRLKRSSDDLALS